MEAGGTDELKAAAREPNRSPNPIPDPDPHPHELKAAPPLLRVACVAWAALGQAHVYP